ncbi:MAG: FAD-dependent oxidoreductase [Acidobacteriota bacterium]|nr:FAD-dependent oxidoreductase [Acidobacteriota bacterium]
MILILGGGLAGLSTAYHLGDEPHLVLEGEENGGGLCRSRTIEGFVFDYTGHLLHLRDPRVIELVERLLPDTFRTIERKAFIRSRGATLPFPFQANLHGLPPEVVAECITGFVESMPIQVPEDPGTSFHEWSLAVFGQGISDAFMFPYNTKLFRRDPEKMTADWVSWAVPKPNLQEVIRGAVGVRNDGMGYNSTFRYPARGGIEIVPRAFADRVEHVRYGARVTSVDLARRQIVLDDGDRHDYERLVVTIPLPAFLRMATGGPAGLASMAGRLDWSVVACWNVGIDRAGVGDGAHWIYVPDADAPFYRVGFPTSFSDGVAPVGTSSMYIEFGLERGEELDRKKMEQSALDALRREGILRKNDRVVAGDWVVIDPGYVIFDRNRQEVMAEVVPALEACGVHLIGRYGAWTYSYMERAILDGLEVAEVLRRAPAAR